MLRGSTVSITGRCLSLLEKSKNMKHLKQAHGQAIACGLGENSFALSRLLAFCSNPLKCDLFYGFKIFKHIEQPTNCICNTMIKACLLKDELVMSVQLYNYMLEIGMQPDNYTLPYVLKACANMKHVCNGELIHGYCLKMGFRGDVFVANTLIVMYSAFEMMGEARFVFDEMPSRGVVSWTVLISGFAKKGDVHAARMLFDESPVKDRGIWGSMISGYVQNNCFKEGLLMFRLMQLSRIEPDEAIFASILCASANVGALDIGIWIHGYLGKMKLPVGVRLGTALIDMYAKCGKLELAKKVFYEMPQRDTICWNAMISGLAMHGDGEGAVKLFYEMEMNKVNPDDITFIAILTACSYSGMVHEGLNFLDSMTSVYNIEPKIEHFGCIIDFLSRGGRFEEAKNIIQRLPNSSSSSEEAVAWRALLTACHVRGNIELAEVAAEILVQLEHHSGVYVLLSNLYSSAGKHDKARKIRKVMKNCGIDKVPGCSSIEINGVVHEFIASEKMHPHLEDIHTVLETMNKQIWEFGYNLN